MKQFVVTAVLRCHLYLWQFIRKNVQQNKLDAIKLTEGRTWFLDVGKVKRKQMFRWSEGKSRKNLLYVDCGSTDYCLSSVK